MDKSLIERFKESTLIIFPLGFISFGGPSAHIALLYNILVTKYKWISEIMFSELFSICQALPGPASTELIYSIGLVHGGFLIAIWIFFLWSIPGFLVMTAAGIGISYISNMPLCAIYLQQGLASSAIGLITSAAYNLSKKNAQDKITKILLIFSASISILYSAPWLYPALMLFGGISTYILYIYNEKYIKKRKLQMNNEDLSEESFLINRETRTFDIEINTDQDIEIFTYSPKIGIVFFVIWLFLLILSIIPENFISSNKIYTIFQKFYIVGSIIFGGGPVVFPLLQSYTVDTGLITINDFLTGIALIQSLPGPNFNISAYLGAVIFHKSISQSLLGAFIAYLSIFIPGLLLKNAIIPFWQIIRSKHFMKEIFKGVNASATGLIISTIWLLWNQINTSKNSYSYHIVISMIAFVSSEHFDISAPIIIIIGGIMGIIEWIMK